MKEMHSKFAITHLKPTPATPYSLIASHRYVRKCGRKFHGEQKFRLKVVGQSPKDRWKLKDIDTGAVQEKLNVWLSKTQNFLNEVTSPLVKTSPRGRIDPVNPVDTQDMKEIYMAEQTIESRTPNGILSLSAIVSIEQFSRMNGLTGQKLQKIFKALVPEHVYSNARNLVEYCCFRFLSRDSSKIHPCLKEPAFQRLIFITMLAWENPYIEENHSHIHDPEKASLQRKFVGEEAFVRIAPAISGVADRPTAHNLFKALAGDQSGVSLASWMTYVDELIKVHEGRESYQSREHPELLNEIILCTGSSRKRPVLKWENNMAWPGKVILTHKALYFEAIGLGKQKDAIRLDLTRPGSRAEKAKVGPFGSALFDSGVSVSSGSGSDPWLLEFVDLGGEMRRDVWHAFMSEVIALHKFINEYGPDQSDQSLNHVYGAHKGKERAIISAINSISRLQSLQFMRKLLDDPTKLVHFSYLQNAPYGDVVHQTLALNYWGGPVVANLKDTRYQPIKVEKSSEKLVESDNHVFDIDGSIFLRKWMRSPSWSSSSSIAFWKNSSLKQGLVLSKNLVVADMTLVERAALECRQRYQVVQKTQATIDAATLEGIASNIDLFKELMLPLVMMAKSFESLRRWEEPHFTISFLALAYTVVFRNLLSYVFPTTLIFMAASMLTLKRLKDQGRLGRSFGKVTIRDQPPSNTIQKIIALKEAMRDVENVLQNLNVALLKIRTIVLSGQPKVTTEVAMILLSSATILLLVPFKYIVAFFIFDLFTRELEFRRGMVIRFMTLLKERWETVPAARVIVLPFESDESRSSNKGKKNESNKGKKSEGEAKPERSNKNGKLR